MTSEVVVAAACRTESLTSRKRKRNLGMSAAGSVTIHVYSGSTATNINNIIEDGLAAGGAPVTKEETASRNSDAAVSTTVEPEENTSSVTSIGAGDAEVSLSSGGSLKKNKRKRLGMSGKAVTVCVYSDQQAPAPPSPGVVSGHPALAASSRQDERSEIAGEGCAGANQEARPDDSQSPPRKKKRAKLSMCSDSPVVSVVSSR
jgi:hypothetical protein